MEGASSLLNLSLHSDGQLQNENVDEDNLPIQDHTSNLSITEDKDRVEAATAVMTCLSPLVYELVTKRNYVIQPIDYLDDQFTINLIVVKQQFGADAVQQMDIVGGARKLHSLAVAVHTKISSFTVKQFNTTYHHYLTWTGLSMVFADCYQQLVANEITAVHVCYLLGAPALERALGNLYLTLSNARQCPSLLRDLLATTELLQCLGAEMMYCLQCLIGPPTGLNLRNIIWHGFPCPGEIPTEFCHLLLVLVATIGRILLQNKREGLRYREFLTIAHDEVIKEYCDVLTADVAKDDLIGLIDKSHFVLPFKKPLWHRAINEYYSGQLAHQLPSFLTSVCIALSVDTYGQHWQSILPELLCPILDIQQYCISRDIDNLVMCYHISTPLLLSELEYAVRKVFVTVNNCPHRLLFAESTKLYTTFDEMMVKSLEDGKDNGLVEELGAPCMEMLLDLLIHPEGPRLRDRISHGEVNIYHLSATIASHVITVAMTLCNRYCKLTTNWISRMNDYCSLFHPLAIMRRELLTLINALRPLCVNHLSDLPKSTPVQDVIKCVGDAIRGMAAVLQQQLIKGGAIMKDVHNSLLDFHMIQRLIQEKWFQLVKTLFVSRDVLEMTGVLRRSIHNCHTAILQVEAMLTRRQEENEKKLLRSRQRTNYELLQESCVVYADVSRLLVHIVMIQVIKFHHHDNHQKIIRSLKKMLQFTEKLSSQTSPKRNRWDVANSLCEEFANKITTSPLLIT